MARFRWEVLNSLVVLVALCAAGTAWAQEAAVINGTVRAAASGAPVSAATVSISSTRGTLTDAQGRFTLRVAPGQHTLTVQSVGYRTATRTVSVAAGATERVEVALAEDAVGLDAVVVSAAANPVTARESTVTINTVEASDLEARQPFTVGDAIRDVPGIMVLAERGRTRSEVRTRGFPEGGEATAYTQILLDGLPMFATTGHPPDQAFKFDLGIERIEVVRGGVATLFGRSAAAGAVNVISRTGGPVPSGTVRLLGGNFAHRQVDANVNGPLASNWFYSATAHYLQDEGPRRTGFDDEIFQVRGSTTRVSDRGRLRLFGAYLDAKTQNVNDVPYVLGSGGVMDGWTNRNTLWSDDIRQVRYRVPLDGNGNAMETGPSNLERGDGSVGGHLGMSFNYDLPGGFSVSNRARYNRIRNDLGFIFALRFLNREGALGLPPITQWQRAHGGGAMFGNEIAQILQVFGPQRINDFVNDLQVQRDFTVGATTHRFTVGSYVSHSHKRTRANGVILLTDLDPTGPRLLQAQLGPTTLFSGGVLAGQVPWRDGDERVTNAALYLGNNVQLSQRLRLALGLRYDQQWMDLREDTGTVYVANAALNGADRDLVGRRYASGNPDRRQVDIGDFSATVGMNFLLAENAAVYGNVNRAFRAPNERVFNPIRRLRPGDPTSPYVQPDVDRPETIYTGEMGLKSAFAGGQLGVDAAAHYTRIDNRLVQAFASVGGDLRYVTISAGSIAIRGLETALTVAPAALPGVTGRFGGTFQRSEYREFDLVLDNANPNSRVDASGKRVPRVPPVILNANLGYQRSTVGGNVLVNWLSARYTDELNLIEVPSGAVVNTSAFYRVPLRGGAVRVMANVNNVLDLQDPLYIQNVRNVALAQRTGDRVVGAVPYPPRRFTLSLGYEF